MSGHTPRFTAKAPGTRTFVESVRLARCTSVAACDVELRDLVSRMHRTTNPEVTASLHAGIDDILDRRTKLAWDEAEEQALRLVRED